MIVQWDEKADVVVVGCGGAGAIAAIAAKQNGVDALVIEKQPQDGHHSNTALSGGSLLLPKDAGAVSYLESLSRIPSGSKWTTDEMIGVYVEYGRGVRTWIEEQGGHLVNVRDVGEHHGIAGYDSFEKFRFAGFGHGLQRFLADKLREKGIPVKYATRAMKLMTDGAGRVVGLEAESNGSTLRIGASRAVILACGGFEYDETMKLNYLPVRPSYFTGTPAATGDGIRMCLSVGVDLWHMNCVSGRLVAKFPDFPMGMSISLDGIRVRGKPGQAMTAPGKRPGYVIVDRDGKRFTNEDFKKHSVYYELTSFDSQRMAYSRVPCFWIMDSRRIEVDSLVELRSGAAGPARIYEWSRDNGKELEKGWIAAGNSIRSLAAQLDIPAEGLEKTVETYNRYCAGGKDLAFGRKPEGMVPLDAPPFFSVSLWPGGPNTQGGPRRNAQCQVMNVDGVPIQGLYSAGEMGSMFGMLYPGGGSNLVECMVTGRVAGERAASERSR